MGNSNAVMVVLGIIAALLTVYAAYMYNDGAGIYVSNATVGVQVRCYGYCLAGEKISNFLIEQITNSYVKGLLYSNFSLPYLNYTPSTITVGDSVGSACDGTLAKLTGITGYAAIFTINATPDVVGCSSMQ